MRRFKRQLTQEKWVESVETEIKKSMDRTQIPELTIDRMTGKPVNES